MLPRRTANTLHELLTRFPAVVLVGPRQVGKTTLAFTLAQRLGEGASYLDLELPSDAAKLRDAELYFTSHPNQLIILDEIHRTPEIFQTLRGVIDQRRRQGQRTGQFLLLGSASIELLKQSSETLAGRIAYIELPGLLVEEIGGAALDTEQLWVRGGFPDSFLAAGDAASFDWRLQFIRSYLERDIPALGPRIPSETLRRLWTMLAHDQGSQLNLARLAAGLGTSGQTVGRYLDLLVDLLLVRRLQPWAHNRGKRLVRAPKIYLRDSGLVHALLGLKNLDEVLGHAVVGGSWEGFVMENVLAAAPPGSQAWFYRTATGAEIDLVLEISSTQRWAIEIKRSAAPAVSKGFWYGSDDIDATRRIVVYAGQQTFPLGNRAVAMGLTTLTSELRGLSASPENKIP